MVPSNGAENEDEVGHYWQRTCSIVSKISEGEEYCFRRGRRQICWACVAPQHNSAQPHICLATHLVLTSLERVEVAAILKVIEVVRVVVDVVVVVGEALDSEELDSAALSG